MRVHIYHRPRPHSKIIVFNSDCSKKSSTNPLVHLNSWLALYSHYSNKSSTNPLPPLNFWLALNSHCSNEGSTNPLPTLNSWLALNSHCSNEGSINPIWSISQNWCFPLYRQWRNYRGGGNVPPPLQLRSVPPGCPIQNFENIRSPI